MTSNTRSRSKSKKMTPEPHHSVYVVELDNEVLSIKKFGDANPNHNPNLACLYVGMTGLTPEERFENHKKNHKANCFVRDYGKWLRKKMFQRFNPMTYEDACKMEESLATKLREKGHAVWQH